MKVRILNPLKLIPSRITHDIKAGDIMEFDAGGNILVINSSEMIFISSNDFEDKLIEFAVKH
jgi:hypothetical protein